MQGGPCFTGDQRTRSDGLPEDTACKHQYGLFEESLQEWLDGHQMDKRRKEVPGRRHSASPGLGSREARLSGRVLCNFEWLEAKPYLTEWQIRPGREGDPGPAGLTHHDKESGLYRVEGGRPGTRRRILGWVCISGGLLWRQCGGRAGQRRKAGCSH